MVTAIVICILLVAGILSVRGIQRRASQRFRVPGANRELELESSLDLGVQCRLVSVRWKDQELLVAQTATGVELVTSNLLARHQPRSISYQGVEATAGDGHIHPHDGDSTDANNSTGRPAGFETTFTSVLNGPNAPLPDHEDPRGIIHV